MTLSLMILIVTTFSVSTYAQQDLSKITHDSLVIVDYVDEIDGVEMQSNNWCQSRIQVKTTKGRITVDTYKKHIDNVLKTILDQCEAIGTAQARSRNQEYTEQPNFDLNFSFNDDPLGYKCLSDSQAYPCFFHLKKKNGFKLELSSQLVKESQAADLLHKRKIEREQALKARIEKKAADRRKIRHFDDALYFIQRAEFDVFKNKTQFMDYFHNDFLYAYSYACKDFIKPAEIRTITDVETTSIGGVDIGSRQLGKTQVIYLEPRFAPQFDAKYKAGVRYLLFRYGLDYIGATSYAVQNREQLYAFLNSKGCESAETKNLLDNLYEYTKG